jgi:hypothetical protein
MLFILIVYHSVWVSERLLFKVEWEIGQVYLCIRYMAKSTYFMIR